MADIIEKISEQIAYHRAELLKLESALEVIAAVSGKQIKAQTPMITIRKTTTSPTLPASPVQRKYQRAKTGKYSHTSPEIEAAIIEDLKTHGPSLSRDIGPRVAEYTDGQNKRLWSALYKLNKAKAVQQDDDNRYFLAAADGESRSQAAA